MLHALDERTLFHLGRWRATEPGPFDPVPSVGPKRTSCPTVEDGGVRGISIEHTPEILRHHGALLVPDPEQDVTDQVCHSQGHWLGQRRQASAQGHVGAEYHWPLVHAASTRARQRRRCSGMPATGTLADALAGMAGAPRPTRSAGQFALPAGTPAGWRRRRGAAAGAGGGPRPAAAPRRRRHP